MPSNPAPTTRPSGGLQVAWYLGDDPRTIRTRAGEEKTIVELRDPSRLSRSLVLWLDGPVGSLADLSPGAVIAIHLDGVRPTRRPGELSGDTSREAVEAAFARARGSVS